MGLPLISSQSRKRDQVVAIDLGARVTKAVHVQRKGDKLHLANYAVLDTPQAGEPAAGTDTGSLADHLREVFRAIRGGRSRQVVLAIGVQDTLFRQIEAPLMPVADLRQMLKFNAKTYLQQDLPDYVFDCFYAPPRSLPKAADAPKTGGGAPKNKVMVGGIKRERLNALQAAVRGAGLVASQVIPSAAGPSNAFENAEPELFRGEATALVDVGFKHTTITIVDGGDLVLNRVVGIGGDRLTQGLSEALKVSYLEAENIKLGMPSEVKAELEPLIQPLGRELRASIDFFEHQQDKPIAQVLLSGGTARSEFILQSLQNELMVQCKTWNPAKNLQVALSEEETGELERVAPQLAVAIGASAAAL
ncbi:MAG: pilus assembly protein PilM [Verrucomicrobia bacterium]|nr:pilus assembly protein PilM [Verrucomicrobiota bacterium]